MYWSGNGTIVSDEAPVGKSQKSLEMLVGLGTWAVFHGLYQSGSICKLLAESMNSGNLELTLLGFHIQTVLEQVL